MGPPEAGHAAPHEGPGYPPKTVSHPLPSGRRSVDGCRARHATVAAFAMVRVPAACRRPSAKKRLARGLRARPGSANGVAVSAERASKGSSPAGPKPYAGRAVHLWQCRLTVRPVPRRNRMQPLSGNARLLGHGRYPLNSLPARPLRRQSCSPPQCATFRARSSAATEQRERAEQVLRPSHPRRSPAHLDLREAVRSRCR